MLRVAIVGCGKVADKHASQIVRMQEVRLVGVCDREELMARQLAERYRIEGAFSSLENLLSVTHPDVVHITTPPQSHHAIALECLRSGCHVYVEKPFTLSAGEAEDLIQLATSNGLKMTVGNETQFSPVACDMRRLIRSGFLGGDPVHMESVYCYELNDERYARALLGDQNHWVRLLPGGLLQNIISHGIGKIVEYLPGETVSILCHSHTSRLLQRIGEANMKDELRMIVADDRGTSAYFTFSSQFFPPIHRFAVYGPKNSLVADHEHQTLLSLPRNYQSYLNQIIAPYQEASQLCACGMKNIRNFLSRQLFADSGIRHLIGAFYRAVLGSAPLPISYRDILMTVRIMDEVFSQIASAERAAGRMP